MPTRAKVFPPPDCPETERLCRGPCKQLLPQDYAHFYYDRAQPSGWRRLCRTCHRAELNAIEARQKAAKAAGGPKPPPALRAVLATLPQAPARTNFRSVLEGKAEQHWSRLADKAVKMALDGDKAMLKLLMAYVLGTPREATEDDGPGDFWHSLLAHAGRADPGADPELGDAPADLGDGGVSTDRSPMARPFTEEPAG